VALNDRRSYDVAASGEAQANLHTVIAMLETLLAQRDADVRQAMADFTADGVAELFHEKELRWRTAADQVRSVITLVKTTLADNDATAQATLQRARGAVDAI
jgi:hypothetical protein